MMDEPATSIPRCGQRTLTQGLRERKRENNIVETKSHTDFRWHCLELMTTALVASVSSTT